MNHTNKVKETGEINNVMAQIYNFIVIWNQHKLLLTKHHFFHNKSLKSRAYMHHILI